MSDAWSWLAQASATPTLLWTNAMAAAATRRVACLWPHRLQPLGQVPQPPEPAGLATPGGPCLTPSCGSAATAPGSSSEWCRPLTTVEWHRREVAEAEFCHYRRGVRPTRPGGGRPGQGLFFPLTGRRALIRKSTGTAGFASPCRLCVLAPHHAHFEIHEACITAFIHGITARTRPGHWHPA